MTKFLLKKKKKRFYVINIKCCDVETIMQVCKNVSQCELVSYWQGGNVYNRGLKDMQGFRSVIKGCEM